MGPRQLSHQRRKDQVEVSLRNSLACRHRPQNVQFSLQTPSRSSSLSATGNIGNVARRCYEDIALGFGLAAEPAQSPRRAMPSNIQSDELELLPDQVAEHVE